MSGASGTPSGRELAERPLVARVVAWSWIVFATLGVLDVIIGVTGTPERGRTDAIVVAGLLLGCGIAYAVGLRPAITAGASGVLIRNPLRDTVTPWRAVREISGDSAVTVRFAGPGGELRTRAWVNQTSPRAQAKAERRARGPHAAAAKGRTPARYTAERLEEIRARHRPSGRRSEAGGAEKGSVTWSWPALAALGVPAVALVVLALI